MAYEEIQQQRISILDPFSDAWQIMKRVLFDPFNLEKWLLIGFCAWLASFGNFRSSYSGKNSDGNDSEFGTVVGQHATEHPVLTVIIISGILLLVLLISLVLNWLKCRGQFMFLDCIVRNYGGIKTPWREYKHEGNNLFVFKIFLGIFTFIAIVISLGMIGFLSCFITGVLSGVNAAIITLVCIGLLISATIFLCLMIVHQFTTDFAVPLMYIYRMKCTEAWRQLWVLINNGNVWRFIGFHLFMVVIYLLILVVVVVFAMVTCGVGCCCMIIPYIGAVVTLPITVFLRAYSYCYLRQYGKAYDVYSVLAVPGAGQGEVINAKSEQDGIDDEIT